MEPTLNEMEDMYESLLVLKEETRKEVEKILGENEILDLENRELSLRKKELFDAVCELNSQQQELFDIYRNFRNTKAEKIKNMRERIDELKIKMAVNKKQLEDLIYGNLGSDVEIKPKCHCDTADDDDCDDDQVKLVYQKLDMFSTVENTTNTSGVAEESANVGDAERASLPEGPTDPSASGVIGNAGDAPVPLPPNDSRLGNVLIRDFGHFHQLKAYLTEKQNTKKVANSLTKAHKKIFKRALTRFCETALEDMTGKFQDLRAEMSLTVEQIMEQFELCVDCEVKSRTKLAILQRFRYLLKKFGKNYPVDTAPKKLGFFKKLFGRNNEAAAARVEAERQHNQVEAAKEMLRIGTLRSEDFKKRLEAANTEKEAARNKNGQLQNDLTLLNSNFRETKMRILAEGIHFREMNKQEDAQLFVLKKTIHQLEAEIELNDFCIRYICRGMKIRGEIDCRREETGEVRSATGASLRL